MSIFRQPASSAEIRTGPVHAGTAHMFCLTSTTIVYALV